ncbi:MAG: purine-binding chemotaxis protein CheW [Candidatus Manganitrophaceae bacterium]|nr:MAG: purine-binding chemotaxis protein CheW [Candidatus Manganitrophaceae bacterium]
MAKKNRQNKQTRRNVGKGQEEIQETDSPPTTPALPSVPEINPSGEISMPLEETLVAVATESPSSMPDSASERVMPKPDDSDPSFLEEKSESNVPEELELLTFNLSEEEYAVDIMVIQEITKLTDITHIPRIPSYIKGIITLRGHVIPVFDMHARLGLAPFVQGPRSRFIICTTENGMVAMLVDRVNDVVRLVRQELDAPPAGVAAIDAGFIRNIARQKDRLLILLEINKTLQIDKK